MSAALDRQTLEPPPLVTAEAADREEFDQAIRSLTEELRLMKVELKATGERMRDGATQHQEYKQREFDVRTVGALLARLQSLQRAVVEAESEVRTHEFFIYLSECLARI